MSIDPCTTAELMTHRVAAEIGPAGVSVLGSVTPLAYAACMLAKLTHAPDSTLIGFNAVDMSPIELSLMGSEAAAYKAAPARLGFMATVNTVYLSGRGQVECVSSAQLDASGAINLSVIGDYERPKVRLPGGAGAPEVVQNYRKMVIYLSSHDQRTLVEQVDFVTGRRNPISHDRRAAAGLVPGPIVVITPLCVLTKTDDDMPFEVQSLHPGVTLSEVVAVTGFELLSQAELPATQGPRAAELRLLREEIDPFGTINFEFLKGSERRQYLRETISKEWSRACDWGRSS